MAPRCDKLGGIDVSAYLDDPLAARWREIRAHADTCRDCREELAGWRSLRTSLTEEGGGHPAEGLLLAYADKRSSLAAGVVEGIEGHLAECPSCRDEVGVLGSVTIWPSEPLRVAAERADGTVWQRMIAALSGPAWRPALAVTVLVVLLGPTLPVLQRIGRDRFFLLDDVGRSRDAVPASRGLRVEPRSRENAVETLGRVSTADAPSVQNDAATRAPVAAPAAPMESSELEAKAPPPLQRPPPAEQYRIDDRQMWTANKRESLSLDAFSGQAMEQHRGIAPALAPLTLDYVPGGRVSIEPSEKNRILLRITFVREPAPGAAAPTAKHSTPPMGGVHVPSTLSQVELRVRTAVGRENSRLLEVDPTSAGVTVALVDVPLDWLGPGENRLDVASRDGRQFVLGSYVLVLGNDD